jgi:hypothetical protein
MRFSQMDFKTQIPLFFKHLIFLVTSVFLVASTGRGQMTINSNVSPAKPVKKISIAVLDLEGSNIDKSDLRAFSNRLGFEIFNTGCFDIFERNRMKDVLAEQGFQNTECVSTDCAIKIGQLIGVEKVVISSIDRVQYLYTVNLRMVNIRTGKIESFVTEDCSGCQITDVFTSIKKAVARLTYNTPTRRPVQQSPSTVRPTFPNAYYPTQQPQYQTQQPQQPYYPSQQPQINSQKPNAGNGTNADSSSFIPKKHTHPKLTLGVRGGGGSCAIFSMEMFDIGWESAARAAWSAGLLSAYNFNNTFSIQADFSIGSSGGGFTQSFIDTTGSLDVPYTYTIQHEFIYATFSPLAKLSHRFDIFTPSLVIGPTFGYNLSSQQLIYIDGSEVESESFDTATVPFEMGLCIGNENEIHLGKGNMIIDVRFQFGFTPVLTEKYKKMTNFALYFTVGYSYDL